jgi:hypothetical protein
MNQYELLTNLPVWTVQLLQIVIVLIICMVFIQWGRDFRLYRGRILHVIRLSNLLIMHSRKRGIVIICILLLCGWLILLGLRPHFSPTVIDFAVLSAILARLLLILRPPGTLLLASSKSWNYKYITSALRPFSRHPIIYLLRGTDYFRSESNYESMIEHEVDSMSNRYIISDEGWEKTVFALMDLVPVIVVDATYLNGALALELKRISDSPGLLKKTLMIIPEGHFYMQNLSWGIDTSMFTICKSIEEIQKKSAILIRAAKKGDKKQF